MGAWIEISFPGNPPRSWHQSHPTWVRGLKFRSNLPGLERSDVAPHVGAWIEIRLDVRPWAQYLSHPTWVRGLKYESAPCAVVIIASHPTWVRGLKSRKTFQVPYSSKSHPTWVRGLKYGGRVIGRYRNTVAPHVGAWIEILLPVSQFQRLSSRTPRGCVD